MDQPLKSRTLGFPYVLFLLMTGLSEPASPNRLLHHCHIRGKGRLQLECKRCGWHGTVRVSQRELNHPLPSYNRYDLSVLIA